MFGIYILAERLADQASISVADIIIACGQASMNTARVEEARRESDAQALVPVVNL